MAERTDEPEVEAPGGIEPIAPATGLVIGLRKSRSRDKDDPRLDAFLDEQTRLTRLQTEHLHEQREVARQPSSRKRPNTLLAGAATACAGARRCCRRASRPRRRRNSRRPRAWI